LSCQVVPLVSFHHLKD